MSGSLSPAHLSPRPESSSLCPPVPPLHPTHVWHHPEPSAKGQGEGSEGLTSSSRASRVSLGVTSCRAPHRHPPLALLFPAGLAWPATGLGWVLRLQWLAGPPIATGRRPGRSCSWGRGSHLQVGARPLGPPGPPGRSTLGELSCLGRFRPAAPSLHHCPGPASLLRGRPQIPLQCPCWQPGSVLRPLVPGTVDERRSSPLPWAWPARAGCARLWGSAPAPPRSLGAAPTFWSRPQARTRSLCPDGPSSLGFARVGSWEAGPVPGIAACPLKPSREPSQAELRGGRAYPAAGPVEHVPSGVLWDHLP